MEPVDIVHDKGQFFRVLQRTPRSQTAVMTIVPGQDAGPEETHDGDQIIYIVEGEAVVRVAGQEHRAGPGTLLTFRPTLATTSVTPATRRCFSSPSTRPRSTEGCAG